MRTLTIAFFGMLLSACYNPINQVTADRYSDMCAQAMSVGQTDTAEEACRRALINARIGHLGNAEESRALYNYARTKLVLGKVEEAEELLKHSLQLEDALSPPDPIRIGLRLGNLAVALERQKHIQDALPYLERLAPLAQQYTGNEREFLKKLFQRYADEFRRLDNTSAANRLQETAQAL